MNAQNNYQHKEPINLKDHPNFEYEEHMDALENLITIGTNSNDYANLSYLSFNLYREKFSDYDLGLFHELKKKYLPDPT